MSAADDRAACEALAAEFDAYQQNTAIAIMTNAAAAKAARLLRAGALAMEQRDEAVRLLRLVSQSDTDSIDFYTEVEGDKVWSQLRDAHTTPVLVVPEAAVKGCTHDDILHYNGSEYCRDCGRFEYYDDAVARRVRPRLLRVGRSR